MSKAAPAAAREAICRVGRSLFERGYVHATAGNISQRLDDGLLITPTDACLGFLEAGRLSRLDAQLQQLDGDRASKTAALHARIYEAARRFDPDTACIIHTHSTHCVALSLDGAAASALPAAGSAGEAFGFARGMLEPPVTGASASPAPRFAELLPALTPYFVMKVGRVPLIPYQRPGAAEAVLAVAEAIAHYGEAGRPIRAVMLERLGPIVWHRTPEAAMAVLEELEETARLQFMHRHGPAVTPLTVEQIDELRTTFGARW